jgi:two-component system, chemotaxis family, sensor kinase CheA
MADEFQFSDDELEQLRGMFFEQATEVIDSLAGLILQVEREPGNVEALRSVRRAVHTLKGDSSAFGFTELMQLAHRYEDALDRVGARGSQASRELIDLLLAGADSLAALISFYRGAGPQPDTTHLVAGLEALRDSAEPATITETTTVEATSAPPAKKKRAPRKRSTKKNSTDAAANPVAPPIPIEVSAANSAPAAAAQHQFKQEAKPEEGPSSASLEDPARTVGRQTTHAMTLRVESERIDAAMNLVGELIIQRSMIAAISAELEAERYGSERERQLGEAVALTARTLSELQESIMRMRLVAIDQVFRRFPRVVRDASIKLDKPLRLEVEGGQTEIDKSIVEVISDPLIHLVRNACDHGIELPEVRRAAGKPEEGVIKLRARRVGNQIAVEVEDDGGGIDPERVVAKAIQKGLVSEREVHDWTDQQKIGLIFLPGFSTAEKISDMSGRGVGMDVVKTTVDSLGGSIVVSSHVGRGSRFTIKLPLTMAIVRAMLFESAGRRFALPLDNIREITRLHGEELKTVSGREVLRLRDKVLPLIRLDEALGLCAPEERAEGRLFVFVLDLGDGRDVGLAVERLYGEQELVLKTVDDALTQSAVVAGASILGDGQVVLILDPYATIEQATVSVRTGAVTRAQDRGRTGVKQPTRALTYA